MPKKAKPSKNVVARRRKNVSKIKMAQRRKPLSNWRSRFSFASKLLGTTSSLASTLIKPWSTWVGPVLGFLSQSFAQWENRCAHDEKRKKIQKRVITLTKLRNLLSDKQKSLYVIPNEITEKKVQGANPYSCSSTTATVITVLAGAAGSAFTTAMGVTGSNEWNSHLSKGLGSGAVLGIATRAIVHFVEEHHKGAVLDSHLKTLNKAKWSMIDKLLSEGRDFNGEIKDILHPKKHRGSRYLQV